MRVEFLTQHYGFLSYNAELKLEQGKIGLSGQKIRFFEPGSQD